MTPAAHTLEGSRPADQLPAVGKCCGGCHRYTRTRAMYNAPALLINCICSCFASHLPISVKSVNINHGSSK